MTRKALEFLPLLLLTGLAGCGGGGGDGSGTATGTFSSATQSGAAANTGGQAGISTATDQTVSAPVFPVQAVMAALVDNPRNSVKNYTDPANDVHTLVGKYAPGVILSFEGLSAKAGFAINSRSKNGTLVWMNSQIDYFDVATYRYFGSILDTGEYVVASNQVQPPATAKIGDSGNLYTFTSFTDNTKTTVARTATATWDLQPDTGSTAYLCMNLHVSLPDGSDSLTSACNKVGANGLLNGSKMIITADGETATFTD
jgi:hypothetical protein